MSWSVDKAHTSLEFSAKHLGIMTVRGRFESFEADVQVEDGRPVAARASIDVASVSTREGKRDEHLKSPDFFDAANHPHITFESSKIQVAGSAITVDGTLTIRDVSKPVRLEGEFAGPFQDPWGGDRIALSVTGKVNRKDWGLAWNVPVGERLLVSDDITLHVDVEVVRQDEAKGA